MADISKITVNNTQYNIKDSVARTDMQGATSSVAGVHGLVPAPTVSDVDKFLKGDGTWADAGGTVYGNTIDMSSTDSTKVATAIGDKTDKVTNAVNGNFAGLDGNGNLTDSGHKDSDYLKQVYDPEYAEYKFEIKEWTFPSSYTVGAYIWTDGENIYYSKASKQYVLDKSTSTWSDKTWNGLTNYDGRCVWTDGENIYYSAEYSNYILDTSTSTWSIIYWSGFTEIDGINVWTDGDYVYFSSSDKQYVFNKLTSTWEAKTWNGLTDFYGGSIWSDGENIYYSGSANYQYVLDKATSTWNTKTWNGYTGIYGSHVWTDGENYYYSQYPSNHYALDKSTSTWSQITWNIASDLDGEDVWSDGENTYFSDYTKQYVLTESQTQILIGEEGQWKRISLDEFTQQIPSGTLRIVPFSISVNNWVLSNGLYSYTYPTAYVTSSSVDFIEYDESFRTALRGDIKAIKAQGGGGVTFTTDVLPVATLSGEIRAFDSDDGRYSVVLQDTVIPIANGGTGASSLVGAQTNLGISGLMTDVSGLTTNVSELNNRFAYEDRSERITIYSSRIKTITHLSYKKYSNGFVEIYITGVANSMASDSVTIFAVSGNNPRLGGYFLYGTASMVNAQLANESGGDYINKSACAVSANTAFVVHLTGYELT